MLTLKTIKFAVQVVLFFDDRPRIVWRGFTDNAHARAVKQAQRLEQSRGEWGGDIVIAAGADAYACKVCLGAGLVERIHFCSEYCDAGCDVIERVTCPNCTGTAL